MTKPLTPRAKEMLLNIHEGREPRMTWAQTRYVRCHLMGGASAGLLQRLAYGGYLETDARGRWTKTLTEAGRAVAISLRTKLGDKRK